MNFWEGGCCERLFFVAFLTFNFCKRYCSLLIINNEGKIDLQTTLVNDFAQRTPFLHVCNNPLQKMLHSLKDV